MGARLRRQRAGRRHGAVRRQLRRPSVRPLGRPARRRPRDHARRGRSTPPGERWELQLKGAGPTPYSRSADGRAVLRSSIREFLCSEAMHHLGVPTTRALSLVAHRRAGRARHVLRRPPEARAGRDRLPRRAVVHPLRQLRAAGVARRRRAARAAGRLHDPPRLSRSCCGAATRRCRACAPNGSRRSASAPRVMVAHWMRVGFVHGVMNTDNMSILGLTIDYGPYGWIDDFDPDWTPNTTDAQRPPLPLRRSSRRSRYWNLGAARRTRWRRCSTSIEPLQAGLQRYVDDATRAPTATTSRASSASRECRDEDVDADAGAAGAAARGRGRHDAVLPRAWPTSTSTRRRPGAARATRSTTTAKRSAAEPAFTRLARALRRARATRGRCRPTRAARA